MARFHRFALPIAVGAAMLLVSCSDPDPNPSNTGNEVTPPTPAPAPQPATNTLSIDAQQERCEGVFGLLADQVNAKYDVSDARAFVTEASAAAEADLAVLKKGGKAKGELSGAAKLGATIKAVVQTKSSVSTEFYQQDKGFVQMICLLNSLIEKPNLSPTDRQFFELERREMIANRSDYLKVLGGLKKN